MVENIVINNFRGRYHGEVLSANLVPHGVGILVTKESILLGNFLNG